MSLPPYPTCQDSGSEADRLRQLEAAAKALPKREKAKTPKGGGA